MNEQEFETFYAEAHARADLALAASDFTLEHYGDLRLSDEQLELGAFAARVCAYRPSALQLQSEVAQRPALYLVSPESDLAQG